MTSASRAAMAGSALACIALLAAGCGLSSSGQSGGSGSSPASTPPSTASSPPPSTVPASTPASSPASTGTSGSSAAAACPTRDLSAKTGPSQGTAGSIYVTIDFTNIGNVTCTLYGYPGVSLGAGSPVRQVGLAATENKTPPRELVTLKPGQVANALLGIVEAGNYSPPVCDPATTSWLKIYPPNQRAPIYLRYSSRTCAKPIRILNVNVVQPGSGG